MKLHQRVFKNLVDFSSYSPLSVMSTLKSRLLKLKNDFQVLMSLKSQFFFEAKHVTARSLKVKKIGKSVKPLLFQIEKEKFICRFTGLE